MKHLETYIHRQKPEYLHTLIPHEPAADMVVVIPCYNEPGLLETLHSLRTCDRVNANVVTVVVLNASVQSDESVIRQNRLTYDEVCRFIRQVENQTEPQTDRQTPQRVGEHIEHQPELHVELQTGKQPGLSFLPLLFEDLPRKHAGVGLARKIGMDLAVAHFLQNGNPRGVIISLDADCTVSPQFFTSIWEAFSCDKYLNATIHDFRHRVDKGGFFTQNGSRIGEKTQPEIPVKEGGVLTENAARQYEAYIRYFRSMLQYTGFPYYYHTVGSAFAVSADAYVRVGGMGRQQGGEDFYFLQKVFALGHIRELNNVCIFPLARLSDRVPFGTGPSLQRIVDDPDGNKRAYSEDAFHVLKQLFDRIDDFYGKGESEVESIVAILHPSLQQFLDEIDFQKLLKDCNENSASAATFRKRFFHHFNAFRIIKYLNKVHPDPFPYISYTSLLNKY